MLATLKGRLEGRYTMLNTFAGWTRSRCRITGRLDGEIEVFRSGGQGCVVATKGDTRPHVPSDRTAGGLIQVNGRVDPKTPNTLSGSTEDVSPSSSSGSSSKCVKTTTWNFQRQ
jgi:hypothetical protein